MTPPAQRLRRAAAAILAISAVAGCGPSDGVDTTPAKPSDLIGQWLVTGDDVEAGTVLNVGAGSMDIFTSCGISGTPWVATLHGTFLAEITSWVGNCFHRSQTNPKADPDWIETVSAIGIAGPGRLVLLDDSGDPVATLTPTSQPPQIPSPAAYTTSESDTEPPIVPAKYRAAMDRPLPPFPAGIRPARSEELLAMWEPHDPTGTYLWFKPSGDYRASDGCNGMAGRWRVVDGQLLWTRGMVTDAGCDNLDPLDQVALVGTDGAELVLLNHKGRETLRMIRSPRQPTDAGIAKSDAARA